MQNNNSHGNGNNNGNISKDAEYKIGERTFKITSSGLDENEVRTYVDELITQRNSLQKRQDNLSALTQLAEKTVIEANSLSQIMMQKATDQAKVEADKIKTKAEQESLHIIEEKKAEAKLEAEKAAELLKTEARRQINAMREEQLKTIKSEAFNLAQRLQNELLVSIENIKKNVLAIGTNFEKTPMASAAPPPVTAEIKKTANSTLSEGEKGALLDHIPWLEIEVLPPLDIEKIMELISRLEGLPEVKTTDLLPETPNPLIRVFLNGPSPLAELLKTLPLVEQVTEDKNTGTADESGVGKKERIRVVLGNNHKAGTNGETKKGATNKSK